MNINLELTQSYYGVFYKLAFLSFIAILLAAGMRRRYPLSTWLLIVGFTTTFFIVGSKLGTAPLDTLKHLLGTNFSYESSEKSAIMGGLLGLLAILGIKKWLRFDAPIADTFAFALPILMLVQRIGCLAAGCCFGVCTHSAFGVRYEGVSLLRDLQINAGILDMHENTSLAVHPVPIYMMVGIIVTLIILWKSQKYLKQSGSLLLVSLICMAFVRFTTEFFRDPMTNFQLGTVVAGLKLVQWLSLVFLCIWAVTLWYREQKVTTAAPQKHLMSINAERNIAVALLLSLFIFSLRNWFAAEEKLVLNSLTLSAMIAQLYAFWKTNRLFSYRLASFSFVILGFSLMSQTKVEKAIATDSVSPPKRHEISLQYSGIKFQEPVFDCIAISQGCIGFYCSQYDKSRPYGPLYNNLKFNYTYHIPSSKRYHIVGGVNTWLEHFYNNTARHSELSSSIIPFLGLENKNAIGFRLGFGASKNMIPLSLWNVGIRQDWTSMLSLRAKIGFSDLLTLQVHAYDSDIYGINTNPIGTQMNIEAVRKLSPKFRSFNFGLESIAFGQQYHQSIYLQADLKFPKLSIKPTLGYIKGLKQPINPSILVRHQF